MRLGATRNGPSAFFTRQFGKYDVLISTGAPGRDTVNEMLSGVVTRSLTVLGLRDRSAGMSPGLTRCHARGPSAASITPQRDGSVYQPTAMSCHGRPPLATPDTTAGWVERGWTSSEWATS